MVIGSIALYDTGAIGDPVTNGRRWAKPIRCLCEGVPEIGRLEDEIASMKDRLTTLERECSKPV